MKDYLNDFKQKKEKNLLSSSAYYNLLYSHKNTYNFSDEEYKISIIVPAYNKLEMLTELINTISKQTYQNFEIILIDDASNDGTYEVYSTFNDRRLKYFLNYENLGVGLSRQKGYNLAQGDYIIFCDHDDYFIDNNYFHDIINIFKDDNINVICSETYTHFEKEDKYLYSSLNLDEGQIDSIEYLKNFMIKYKKPTSLFPAAFRRKALIESNIKMTRIYDTSTYLRALMIGGKTFINKKIIGIYRVHGENETFNLKAKFITLNLEEKMKIYDYLKKHNTIPNVDEWYSKQIAITVDYFLENVRDKNEIDYVLNWIYKNISYEEYLKYKKKAIKMSNIKLFYYRYPNVGDMLNETILSSLFQLKFELDVYQTADLAGVGSILDLLLTNSKVPKGPEPMQNEWDPARPIHIWGTGLMHYYEDINQETIRPLIIHALRGEKTRKQLEDILGKTITCLLADPGLLSSLIVEPNNKKYFMGIIPHYIDKNEEIFKKMLEYYPNSKFIDVQNEPETVLKEISECENIISTSLHGLIIADSYGIQNCWCEISDKILGNRFKFHDYFSSFGTDREVFDLRSGEMPNIDNDFKCNFKSINQIYEKQKALLECFPLID